MTGVTMRSQEVFLSFVVAVLLTVLCLFHAKRLIDSLTLRMPRYLTSISEYSNASLEEALLASPPHADPPRRDRDQLTTPIDTDVFLPYRSARNSTWIQRPIASYDRDHNRRLPWNTTSPIHSINPPLKLSDYISEQGLELSNRLVVASE